MLLVGSGEIMVPLPPIFYETCREHKIGVQVESTQQAIQTYGVLLDDNRSFAALMIPSTSKTLPDDEKVYLQKSKLNRKALMGRGK